MEESIEKAILNELTNINSKLSILITLIKDNDKPTGMPISKIDVKEHIKQAKQQAEQKINAIKQRNLM